MFFRDDTPGADVSLFWNSQAGLLSGSLTSFTNASHGVFSANAASQAAAPLGQVTVTGGSFTVFIDHQTYAAQRTWYAGVGYTAVPEPSVGALGLLALPGVAARRRTS